MVSLVSPGVRSQLPPSALSEKLVWKNKMTASGVGPTGVDRLREQLERGDVYRSTQRDFERPSETDMLAKLRGMQVVPTRETAATTQVADSHARIFG
jgi:hypothetical protein